MSQRTILRPWRRRLAWPRRAQYDGFDGRLVSMARSVYQRRPGMLVERTTRFAMLLHLPRQRVEISSPRVRRESLPRRQSTARGLHRCIDIRR